jgi:hypothetical protein
METSGIAGCATNPINNVPARKSGSRQLAGTIILVHERSKFEPSLVVSCFDYIPSNSVRG